MPWSFLRCRVAMAASSEERFWGSFALLPGGAGAAARFCFWTEEIKDFLLMAGGLSCAPGFAAVGAALSGMGVGVGLARGDGGAGSAATVGLVVSACGDSSFFDSGLTMTSGFGSGGGLGALAVVLVSLVSMAACLGWGRCVVWRSAVGRPTGCGLWVATVVVASPAAFACSLCW